MLVDCSALIVILIYALTSRLHVEYTKFTANLLVIGGKKNMKGSYQFLSNLQLTLEQPFRFYIIITKVIVIWLLVQYTYNIHDHTYSSNRAS